MDFEIPAELKAYLTTLDEFIEAEIRPLQAQDDNERFFDHRREWARTDFENGGLHPGTVGAAPWEMRRRADAAGHYRYALPKEFGGQDGTNLGMAVIREHLAAKGLGLHNDLQNEASIVANNPFILMMRDFGTEAQKAEFIENSIAGKRRVAFGLTEPRRWFRRDLDECRTPCRKPAMAYPAISSTARKCGTRACVATHDMVLPAPGVRGRRRPGHPASSSPQTIPG